jgi:hypothetical protein
MVSGAPAPSAPTAQRQSGMDGAAATGNGADSWSDGAKAEKVAKAGQSDALNGGAIFGRLHPKYHVNAGAFP